MKSIAMRHLDALAGLADSVDAVSEIIAEHELSYFDMQELDSISKRIAILADVSAVSLKRYKKYVIGGNQ